MKTTELSFPTTVEAFIAHQEAGIHRALSEDEQELSAVVVEVINMAYRQGCEGYQGFEDTVDGCVAQGVFQAPATPEQRRFMESVVYWNNMAYRQGRRDAEEAAV